MARSRVRTRERRLHVGGCGWLVRARPCTEGVGRLAGAVGSHMSCFGIDQLAPRAHAASARAAPSPEREHAVERSRVCTLERRLLVGDRGWHVGARPCTEREGRLAGAVGLSRARTGCNQHAASRARRKRACYASSRESTRWRGGVCAYANAGGSLEAAAGTSKHSCAPRLEGRLAGAVGFHRAWTDSNHHGAARRKRASCASARERERGGAFA